MLLLASGLTQATQPRAAAPEPAAGSGPLPADAPTVRPPGTPAPFVPPRLIARTPTTSEKSENEAGEADKAKEPGNGRKNVSDLVGVIGALAWPVSLLLIIIILLTSLRFRGVRALLGIAMSIVRKVKIAGTELEIDPDKIGQFQAAVVDSFDELMKKAEPLYKEMVKAQLVRVHFSRMIRQGLPEVLRNRHLNEFPPDMRATIHVPDIVVNDYLYQLVPYFPRPAAGGAAGRRFSQRYGLIGRAWRLQQSKGQGEAVHGADAATQLIEHWGMTADEAANASHLQPAILCIILRDPDAADVPIGLVYIDSMEQNAFSPVNGDDVAAELENHQFTKALATAVANAMRPLRFGPPGVDISS